MSTKNSFNYIFLKRFAHLIHVFLPISRLSLNVHDYKEGISTHPLFLIFLILINQIGLQFIIYYVGLIPSEFYVELSKSPKERDFPLFLWLVFRALAYAILNAFLKSLSSFLSSILYVKWRMRLVLYLHSFYFTQQRYYHLLNTTQQNPNRQIDDDDDRASVYRNYTTQT
jgi:ATP-binding cassette subfamily D (ALD) protein 4